MCAIQAALTFTNINKIRLDDQGQFMSQKLLRGRVLSFHAEPQHPKDEAAYRYIDDGALLIENGMIIGCGAYSDLAAQASNDAEHVDHRPHLLLPGFIDTHLHFPQVQVIASWGAQLLDWLENYTFPAESRFADPTHAARMSGLFFDQLIANGTTTSVAYCSSHKSSADAYFAEAEARNMRVIGGKVLMDRNAPEAVRDTPQSGYDDTKALIAEWHGKGRAPLCNHATLCHHVNTGSDGSDRSIGQGISRLLHPDPS